MLPAYIHTHIDREMRTLQVKYVTLERQIDVTIKSCKKKYIYNIYKYKYINIYVYLYMI